MKTETWLSQSFTQSTAEAAVKQKPLWPAAKRSEVGSGLPLLPTACSGRLSGVVARRVGAVQLVAVDCTLLERAQEIVSNFTKNCAQGKQTVRGGCTTNHALRAEEKPALQRFSSSVSKEAAHVCNPGIVERDINKHRNTALNW